MGGEGMDSLVSSTSSNNSLKDLLVDEARLYGNFGEFFISM